VVSARSFLIRGLLAGLIAGFVAFGVAFVIGEPSINAAIALEEGGSTAPTGHTHDDEAAGHSHDDPAAGHSHGEEAGTEVPRSLQSTLGLLTGTAVAGTTLGGLVGVLSALALGRLGRLGVRGSTLAVAAVGFVALYVVPFVVYPPNPPAVGNGDTIGARTALYFIAVAISVIAAVLAVLVGRRLADRLGGWHAAVAAVGGYLVVVIVALGLLPRYDEVPAGFPAGLLYEFRTASFLIQLTLWTVLGVVLAELVGRLTRPAARDRELATVGD
jgi:predicted cobalt transporter CbtA